jgi:8-oxo-dGTP pyrophosphatase MutT (NUDIX family)
MMRRDDRDRPTIRVVAAALYDSAGRVLIAERPPGKHLAGSWEFPGGKINAGETEGGTLAASSPRSWASQWMRATHSCALRTTMTTGALIFRCGWSKASAAARADLMASAEVGVPRAAA